MSHSVCDLMDKKYNKFINTVVKYLSLINACV